LYLWVNRNLQKGISGDKSEKPFSDPADFLNGKVKGRRAEHRWDLWKFSMKKGKVKDKGSNKNRTLKQRYFRFDPFVE
jgi:hypothetical protein